MRWTNKQTNKFSFGNEHAEQINSAIATPKFTQINETQFHINSDHKQRRHIFEQPHLHSERIYSSKGEKANSALWRLQLFRRLGKQKPKLQEANVTFNTEQNANLSRQVQSLSSLRHRVSQRQKKYVKIEETKRKEKSKQKQSLSLRSFTGIHNSPYASNVKKSNDKNNKKLDKFKYTSKSKQKVKPVTNESNYTLIKNCNFYQIKTAKIKQFTSFSKNIQSKQSKAAQQNSKSFKILFHKSRPILNFKQRILTNDRIQTISKQEPYFHKNIYQ